MSDGRNSSMLEYSVLSGTSGNLTAPSGANPTRRHDDAGCPSDSGRALRLLSGCNSALIHAENEYGLVREICRQIVGPGGYVAAWVDHVGESEDRSLIRVAEAMAVDASDLREWCTDRAMADAAKVCIDQGQLVIRTVSLGPGSDNVELQANSMATLAVLPIGEGGVAISAISIVAGCRSAFTPAELALLSEIADDMAYGIGRLRDAKVLARVEAELEHQQNFDRLTGIPNYTLFQEWLRHDLAKAKRHSQLVAVLVLGIDRFKEINDTFGHDVGNDLLRKLVKSLTAAVREGDTLARISGSEFIIALTKIAREDDIAAAVKRIKSIVHSPIELGDCTVSVGFSIGISIYPRNGDEVDRLVRCSGAAMHAVMASGGNDIQYYVPDMNERLTQRFAMESDIRKALARGEFRVFYQPKVSLTTGRIVGAEALLRWQHPDRGFLMPTEFIPMAESNGQIVQIGDWVLDQVCSQIARWGDAGIDLTVAVNLSARQFRSEGLLSMIEYVVGCHHVSPGRLEFEITESTLMECMTSAIPLLDCLRERGFHLSLDDFGTGYSSLSYLKRMPVTALKIDRSFVQDIVTTPDDYAICRAIIDLAHNLQLDVVAEGVESEGQLMLLAKHHCDQIQGFLVSKAVPAEQFSALFTSGVTLSTATQSERWPTLLLVDDEPETLASLKRLFRRDHYRVLEATSAGEALQLLASEEVHVVLSDLHMPGMSGIELLARVKSLHPNVERMMLSGVVDASYIIDAVNRASVTKFLCKPWEPDDLREQVRQAFIGIATRGNDCGPMPNNRLGCD